MKFPFTKTVTEDVMFLNSSNNDQYYEAISLEAVFYQQDCHYYELKENTDFDVNRMGTENY